MIVIIVTEQPMGSEGRPSETSDEVANLLQPWESIYRLGSYIRKEIKTNKWLLKHYILLIYLSKKGHFIILIL